MKLRSRDNRRVREAKIFEIAAVVSVAVRTVGPNLRGIRESVCPKLRVLPKILAGRNGRGVAQGWRPGVGIFFRERVRFQHLARISSKKIQCYDPESAHKPI